VRDETWDYGNSTVTEICPVAAGARSKRRLDTSGNAALAFQYSEIRRRAVDARDKPGHGESSDMADGHHAARGLYAYMKSMPFDETGSNSFSM
jgi:hypothetical protein